MTEPLPQERRLEDFWKNQADDRDLALGYAVVAPAEPSVRPRALELLERAAAKNPIDVPILAQLAQFYDRLDREEQAMAVCERLLRLDGSQTGAAVNLGIYRMKRGRQLAARPGRAIWTTSPGRRIHRARSTGWWCKDAGGVRG